MSAPSPPQASERTPELKDLAMIFDMDGVLVHSMPLHVMAWVEYLRRMGIEIPDLERRMHGKRNTELVWDFIGKHVPEQEAFEHGAAKERLFRELMASGAPGEFDIAGVVPFLERYRHVPKAIGSNAEQENIDYILDRLGLRHYFEFTINGLQVDRPKPFPDIYLECARRLGFPPANCIVFEDSPAGAAAGLSAGMRVVGVESTPTQFQDIALKVDHFHDPQLAEWLSEQRPA